MAIIKTYPLKTTYFSQDRLVLSDMQPDSEGIVKGETKSLTLASLKNFIGSQVLDVSASTTDRYKGAFVSPSIGNVKVGIDLLPLTMLLAPNGFDYLLVTDDPSGNPINKKTTVDNFFSSVGLITNSSINYTVKLPSTVGNASQVLQLPSVIGSSPHQLEWSSPAGSGTVIGTGTTNYIPKWNSSTELTDSVVYESGTNIGIGTTNPAFKLEVINTIGVSGTRPIRMNSATGAVDIRGSGTGGWANAFNFNGSANTVLGGFGCLGLGDGMNYWYIGSAYNNATMVIKPNNGNVGIGTTAPSQKLTVSGKGLFETGGSTPDPTIATYEKGITLTSGGAGNQRLVIDVSDVTNGGSYIQTRHQSTGFPTAEYVLALNPLGGDVGIGTSSPSDGDLTIGTPKLHVAAGGTSGTFNLAARFQSTTTDADNTGTSILINSSNDRGLLIKAGRKDGDREVAYFDVVNSIGTTTNMLTMGKFDSAFNVGIGTTTPAGNLQVVGGNPDIYFTSADTGQSDLYFGGVTAPTKGNIKYSDNADAFIFNVNTNTEAMRIISSGNVGIGTTAPNAKLHVQDTSGSTSQIRISAASSNANYAFIKMEDVTANTSKLTLGATIGYSVEKPALSIFDSYTTLLGNGTSNGRLLFNCSANTHSVEIVGPDHSGGSSYSLKLPNSLPSVSNQILESNALGVLSWIPTPSGGGGSGGTVTSVGLSVPPAFSVGNSPITGSGTISLGISTSANPGEFLAYNGQWATPPDTGTIVVGNPSTGASTVLSGISIGSTTYSIPQGTGTGNIASVGGQNGLSGSGSSGNVLIDNIDRGSDQNIFKTISPHTGTDVVANSNSSTLNLAAGSNTGIFVAGAGSQITIGLYQPTTLALGGVKLVNVATQSEPANGLTTTAGRTYAMQLNSSGQAVVNVPWSGGSGGGISFSGSTSGGLATFTNSSTAGVSSKVTLNANGVMQFDSDNSLGVNYSRASIDYNPTGNRMQIGDFTSNQGGIVEFYTNGSLGFQIGINGELGLGTGASQGTSGQFLQSQGNGLPAIWSSSGAGGGSFGTYTTIQISDGSGGFSGSGFLKWIPISGTKGKLQLGGNSGGITDREGILRLQGGPNTAGTSGVGGTIEFEAAVGKSGGAPGITKIKAPTSNSTSQDILLPSALPTANTQVLGIASITGAEVTTKWTTSSGGGITQTIIPWYATLTRVNGTSWADLDSGALLSNTMVINENNCFATIQGNVVNYQFYISGYFRGNYVEDGQYLPIKGPLFLARSQNADGTGTISGIPIEASQSTTVIDNRFANGSLTVTEDPFVTKQVNEDFDDAPTTPEYGQYWRLPIRGGKVGRAIPPATSSALPGFVQLFTSAGISDNKPGKDWSTCRYIDISTDTWYRNEVAYMPSGKGYNFVFAGTITAFVTQS